MKAADARRQGLVQRKRLHQLESYNDADDPRLRLAERLLGALEDDTQAKPTGDTRLARGAELTRLETSLETLCTLRDWIERFVELQMMWVNCSARLDDNAAVRVWNRMDKIMRRVTEERDSTQQLALLSVELPRLVDKARELLVQHDARVHKEALVSTANSYQPLPASVLTDLGHVRDPVTLPHQWLPRVILDICNSVEREYAAGRCRPALVDATRKILQVVRDRNPYAFFSVLYRPPPASTGVNVARDWILYASPQIDAIARLLHADFDKMRDFAWWMEKPDSSFWKSFGRLMRCVRRVAIAFHRVMIHLYATAMQRQDPYITVNDVAYEIDTAQATHLSFTLQSDGYGLASWFGTASDAIFHETYVMFPEVLVYVDQWRHEFAVYEHGFAPTERARDYEVGYHKWKNSKTWLEIAHQAKRTAQAWNRSRLGTRDFRSISFLHLGRLEKDIKQRLAKITDLLYKQNIAKWSQQRYQHTRARALMELEIMAKSDCSIASATCASKPHADQDKPKRFRPPTHTRVASTKLKVESDKSVTHDTVDVSTTPVEEDAIRKWTDDEIDAHEQETERLYELQGGMMTASDTLSLSAFFCDDEQDHPIDAQTSARGLLASCRRLQTTTRTIVARGEAIALHGAAEALIQRPTLRLNHQLVSETDDPCDAEEADTRSSTEALETAVRASALQFLNLHQATATDSDAQASAQELALEALSLLRQAHALTV